VRGTGQHIPGLGRIRAYLLLAHLFAIFTLAAYISVIVLFLVDEWLFAILPGLGSIVLLLLVPTGPTIFVILWVDRMRKSLKYGHYRGLVRLNSLGVALVALVFGGLVAGVFLLLARRHLPRPPKVKRRPKFPELDELPDLRF
jgi:hypothetical protein